MGEQFFGFSGMDCFVKIIIHQTNGCRSAGGETLGKLDGEASTRRDGNRVVMGITGRAVDACELAEAVHQLVAATHSARKRPADTDMKFAGSRLAKARVETHHFENFDRLDSKLGSHPLDGRCGNETKLVLHNVEQGQGRRPLTFRVMGDARICLSIEFRTDAKRHIKLAAGCLVGGDGFCKSG